MGSLRLTLAVLASLVLISSQVSATGFVEKSDGNNEALLVGVGHGLSGLDKDVDNVDFVSQNASYKYARTILEEEAGTVKNISDNLTMLADKAGDTGTFFFYFTGHGNVGLIWPQDNTMDVKDIRAAIEKGRTKPLKR